MTPSVIVGRVLICLRYLTCLRKGEHKIKNLCTDVVELKVGTSTGDYALPYVNGERDFTGRWCDCSGLDRSRSECIPRYQWLKYKNSV